MTMQPAPWNASRDTQLMLKWSKLLPSERQLVLTTADLGEYAALHVEDTYTELRRFGQDCYEAIRTALTDFVLGERVREDDYVRILALPADYTPLPINDWDWVDPTIPQRVKWLHEDETTVVLKNSLELKVGQYEKVPPPKMVYHLLNDNIFNQYNELVLQYYGSDPAQIVQILAAINA